MRLLSAGKRMSERARISSRRGQNSVEYLLMVTVVVGVVLVSGVAMKQFMPSLFGSISQMITGASSSMSGGGTDAGAGAVASSPGYMSPGAVGGDEASTVAAGNDGGTAANHTDGGSKTRKILPH